MSAFKAISALNYCISTPDIVSYRLKMGNQAVFLQLGRKMVEMAAFRLLPN